MRPCIKFIVINMAVAGRNDVRWEETGWKGGKALPFGGSFGEYSLNDFEEQPSRENGTAPLSSLGGPLEAC